MRDVPVTVLVGAGQDAVGAGSGWLRSPALLARVVEQRLSSRAREIRTPGNKRIGYRAGGQEFSGLGLGLVLAWQLHQKETAGGAVVGCAPVTGSAG